MSNTPPLAITTGEPAGIGPDLVIQLAQQSQTSPPIIIADADLLQDRAQQLGLAVDIEDYNGQALPAPSHGKLFVLHTPLKTPCHAGKLDAQNAAYVLETLRIATQGCMEQHFAALVTGPVHKGIINDAGHSFSGHTEYLAELSNCSRPVMMLAAGNLRVALATTHLPLSQVSRAITPALLEDTLRVLHNDLQYKFSINNPAITVCGLNPHAGEQGHLGREEIDIIEPVINELRSQGLNIAGPIPADTAFTPGMMQNTDAYLTMYHDQGLPVLKHVGFNQAINITLGLPFIRTSVDHGTAIELAGSGKANTDSLSAAISLAASLAQTQPCN